MMRKRPPEQDRPTRLRVTASGMAGVVMAVLMGAVGGGGVVDTHRSLVAKLVVACYEPEVAMTQTARQPVMVGRWSLWRLPNADQSWADPSAGRSGSC
jgi:hypothetical protein